MECDVPKVRFHLCSNQPDSLLLRSIERNFIRSRYEPGTTEVRWRCVGRVDVLFVRFGQLVLRCAVVVGMGAGCSFFLFQAMVCIVSLQGNVPEKNLEVSNG